MSPITVGVADLRTPRALTWLVKVPQCGGQEVSIESAKILDKEAVRLSLRPASFIHHGQDASAILPGW